MHVVEGADAAPPRTARLVAGRYLLEQPIGRGAMGTVWRGRDTLLDRAVAIKEVRSCVLASAAENQDAYLRTLREAKAAARLNHPAVVTVFDVFEEHGTPWIVMELVAARSLDRVVAEDGPLRPQRAARLGEHLLSALVCAHAAGVLHRDVKPGNVLVAGDTEGGGTGAGGTGAGAATAVLTDFGIATVAGDPALTQAGMVFGTPGFTAPERIYGDPATPASDLWSLGATLYMAVEGRGPFDRPGGSAAIIAGVAGEPAPRAPSAGPLGPVIDALLQADPARRPDAATAARMLAGVSAGPPHFPDQSQARRQTLLDAPSLLDQPEFLCQSGLLQPPDSGGRASGASGGTASGFPAPRRRGRVRMGAITVVAAIVAGFAGYAAYPRPADLDVTSPPAGQGQATPATGTSQGSNTSSGSQPAGGAAASPAGSGPASGTGQNASSAGTTAGAGTAEAPAGYRWYQVTATASGTVAGFEFAVPDTWPASGTGLDSILRSPDSGAFIEVSLASFRYSRPLREAGARQAQAAKRDPGYHLAGMRTGTFLGAPDAVWDFSWQAGGTRVSVEELLVSIDTSAGTQDYALAVSAPSASLRSAQAAFGQALATFQTVP
jgi:serine/threonine protein kinase